ncbi:F-box domain-containing protein [Mycena chlorophos]|uniref:F-box domain-containing protein n=1 Tax=Mycena chlorophos TaxID=658473 RepID=A0A8H6SX83_MYCCL|nr:F-box domain-containing protein [Mycena chlorophos]
MDSGEIHRISASPSHLRAQKTKVDDSVRDLERQLAQLRSQRNSFDRELSKIIFPVLNLPSDITLAIFSATLDCFPDPFDATRQLRSLVSICSEWRTLILNTPTLWQCIALDAGLVHYEDLFHLWVSRAGPESPLDIFFRIPTRTLGRDVSMAGDNLAIWKIPKYILSLAPRWRELHFYTPALGEEEWPTIRIRSVDVGLSRTYAVPDGGLHAPNLKRMTLPWNREILRPLEQDIFTHVPRLRELKISNADALQHMGFPAEQLTKIEFLLESMYSLPEIMDVLSLVTRNLQVLLLSPVNDKDLGTRFSKLPPFRALHTLAVSGQSANKILDCMTASALRDLRLEYPAAPVAAVKKLVARSNARVLRLQLTLADRRIVDNVNLGDLWATGEFGDVEELTIVQSAGDSTLGGLHRMTRQMRRRGPRHTGSRLGAGLGVPPAQTYAPSAALATNGLGLGPQPLHVPGPNQSLGVNIAQAWGNVPLPVAPVNAPPPNMYNTFLPPLNIQPLQLNLDVRGMTGTVHLRSLRVLRIVVPDEEDALPFVDAISERAKAVNVMEITPVIKIVMEVAESGMVGQDVELLEKLRAFKETGVEVVYERLKEVVGMWMELL